MSEPTLFDDIEDDDEGTFGFYGESIRYRVENDKVWVDATDAAQVLGYSQAQAVVKSLVTGGSSKFMTPTGPKSYLSEQGFYRAVMKSKHPAADEMIGKAAEIFTMLRKTGVVTIEAPASEDDIVLRAVDILQRRVATAEAKVAELEPAAEAYHGFLDSEGLINLSDGWRRIRTVHPLKMPEYFGLLRAWDVVFTTSGESTLKSWFTDKGYGKNIDIIYEGNSGGHHRLQGKLTPAGVDYLLGRFGRFQRGITDGREAP